MCLGSVLVLGWGSWAKVGMCLCGFVRITIRALCGCATVLLYACICLCVHCEAGMCYSSNSSSSSSSIVPTSPSYSSFLPSFPPGCGQQTGTDCSVPLLYSEMTCGVIGDDDWAEWQIRPGGYERPTNQAAPGAPLRCAMSHQSATTRHTIKNDKCSHQLLSQVSRRRLMLLQLCVCPSSSAGLCHARNNHLFKRVTFHLRCVWFLSL